MKLSWRGSAGYQGAFTPKSTTDVTFPCRMDCNMSTTILQRVEGLFCKPSFLSHLFGPSPFPDPNASSLLREINCLASNEASLPTFISWLSSLRAHCFHIKREHTFHSISCQYFMANLFYRGANWSRNDSKPLTWITHTCKRFKIFIESKRNFKMWNRVSLRKYWVDK